MSTEEQPETTTTVDQDPSQQSRRLTVMTIKGQEQFQRLADPQIQRITKKWDEIDTQLKDADQLPNEKAVLLENKSAISLRAVEFEQICSSYIEFLNRHNSVESNDERERFQRQLCGFRILIDSAIRKLTLKIQDIEFGENCSTSSKQTRSSRSSHYSLSSIAAKKRAKAEALKASFAIAEDEARLKRRQADLIVQKAITEKENVNLDTEINLLNIKRESIELSAEAKALEEDDCSLKDLEEETPIERTRAYLRSVPLSNDIKFNNVDNEMFQNEEIRNRTESVEESHAIPVAFTRYLLKKDLLLSRLTSFNDKPELYPTWKNSFKTIMHELQATPTEEMDLLIKWSGPSSQRHMISIKAANSCNPEKALSRSWARLDERYGCPEMMEAALKSKLDAFPAIHKDMHRLYDLSDILDEIESAKENVNYACLLAYFDSSTGVTPIVKKLPIFLQGKWTSVASSYMQEHRVPFPPFSVFVSFIREQSRVRNNPAFTFSVDSKVEFQSKRYKDKLVNVTARKTEVVQPETDSQDKKCPLHNTYHTLNKCRGFRHKSLEERRKFLKEKNLCFKCCESRSHKQRDCKSEIKCEECSSSTHPTALHVDIPPRRQNGGESQSSSRDVISACTQICGDSFNGKSCAKTLLVRVYPENSPQRAVNMYAVVDDQSNRSLAGSRFFDIFGCKSDTVTYLLSSCGGSMHTSGRKADGFIIEAHDRSHTLNLPTLIECNQLPNSREEIPTPMVAKHYHHLKDIASCIPEIDPNADILLLLGRDIIEAHHVLDQRIGSGNVPYAQKLRLGWTIIGETCLGKTHKPSSVNAFKTHILESGRASLCPPCTNEFRVREDYDLSNSQKSRSSQVIFSTEEFGKNVFHRTKHDERPGMSANDLEFLKIMNTQFEKDDGGHWVAPLPFKESHAKLPNNKELAFKRAKSLEENLLRNPKKKEHFFTFMEGILRNGHAERAPPVNKDEECWYLPIFGVYHPKKPDKVRVVFDSSARFDGVSLNDVLLTGPDLTNSLLGVLLRFRKESVAVMGDIEQMFYCFKVSEDHRNFLRFLWHEDNDPGKPLIEYRMTVHVFGNKPSPAVATYGLRKTAHIAETKFGEDVTEFVENNFYVDDGLASLPTTEQAVDLMQRTQQALKLGNLRLHKIASNSKDVLSAFPPEDLASDMTSLEFETDTLPSQRSLGLNWNLETDTFFFVVNMQDKANTRRGILSAVNSVFDPLGFLSPVVIEGKNILRQISNLGIDWDETLPSDLLDRWLHWRNSLAFLKGLHIPRTYLPESLALCEEKSIHVFCDASELAIAAVGYIKTTSEEGQPQFGFIMGKAKLAPLHGHSIPRLELCAAVLAVEVAYAMAEHLRSPIEEFRMYTDSKVVLGYIFNKTRRFYTYVTNRVSFIRKMTKPEQWSYISTEKNPADQATRVLPSQQLKDSTWLNGPECLTTHEKQDDMPYDMIDPNDDKDVRPEVTCYKTDASMCSLGSHRFAKFSSWKSLVETVALLCHIAGSFVGNNDCVGWHVCSESKTVGAFQESERLIIKTVQKECYGEEIDCLEQSKPLSNSSSLLSLDVFLDDDGLLRVGGRLNRSNIPRSETNPILIPGKHHIATLLVQHFHAVAKHQGRHITSGTIRSAGFWITGGKRLISSVLYGCVKCRKLRGKFVSQKMADLPPDRLQPGPPFTYIGIDTFGPWEVVTRKTRGGALNSKRWAILFTCMTTRGIHIEVIEEMTSSSFINAFKRFVAIRGKVKQIRSDRGTNFIGATDDLKVDAVKVEDKPVKDFLYNNGIVWLFNPPHSSHFGGVWERLIGVTRRVLDSMLMDISAQRLTHEVLTTFMAEASAIVNSRPLVPLSTDPEDPMPLSPAMILTQKPDVSGDATLVDAKDLYRVQWKRVQHLADTFWKKWRNLYLQTLQNYQKWKQDKRNLAVGDVVLLKDNSVVRNYWPLGLVTKVFPSSDSRVRKVEVRVVYREGGHAVFIRPVTELVLLCES